MIASNVFCTISFVLSWVIPICSEIAFTMSFFVTTGASAQRGVDGKYHLAGMNNDGTVVPIKI